VANLSQIHGKVANLLHNLPAAVEPEISRLGLVGALQQSLEREFKDDFDLVSWQIAEQADQKSMSLPGMDREVLFYAAREAIRNAARHGRGPEQNLPLKLSLGVEWDKGLKITIEDNGIGFQKIEPDHPGFNRPGSGRGLALHSTMMAVIGGLLTLESSPGVFTRVILILPEKQI
jgi:signal transduction histidine kinase